jgi:hypothetical protein
MTRAVPVVFMVGLLLAGCASAHKAAAPVNAGSAGPARTGGPGSTARTGSPVSGSVLPGGSSALGTGPAASTPYERAVDASHSRGLQVWLEADLVKRWLAGPDQFNQGVDALGRLAARPGVVGIKIADELGYHYGLGDDASRVLGFLADARAALSKAAPGKLLLVDFVIPDLGCAPGAAAGSGPAACTARWDAAYPALALGRLDAVFASGSIDVADISTGLEDDSTYTSWGIDRDRAQRAAWAEVARRGWGRIVQLQARKALAHPDGYRGGSGQAQSDSRTFVDIPLAAGARAVDIWAWRQLYQGQIVRLMDPDLTPNPLWDALRQRRAQGDVLFTHFTPSQVERGLEPDLDQLASVFRAVYVAAGIG